MLRPTVAKAWTTILTVLAVRGACLWAAESTVDRPTSAPSDVAELKALEARACDAIRKALPAVVAVNVPRPTTAATRPGAHSEGGASGVLIRRDGLILSQRHVSHVSRQPGKKETDLAAGDRIDVALQDGRRLKAELLSSDPTRDLSLLRLVDPGDYPHLDLAKSHSVAPGDRVIKLGHP